MKKTFLMAATLTGALAFSTAHAEGPHWGYGGKHGAAHWGDMDENFKTCKLGKHQSPINIETGKATKGDLKPIEFHYNATPAEIINNGHTIQIGLQDGGSANFNSAEYKLLQFHFHTPSEEKINGRNYPLVAHLVHKDAEGRLAVVAVLFKQGNANTALKSVFSHLPAKAGDKQPLEGGFDVTSILPTKQTYYAFTGSLTTPPCSEEVSWHVLKEPVTLSRAQLSTFKKLYTGNARPVQPLNGRKVLVSE